MNKKIIVYELSLAIILAIFFCLKTQNQEEFLKITPSFRVSVSTTTKISQLPEKKIQISLVAGEKSYTDSVPSGSTIYDAMNILASTTDFSFKSTFYPGLGYFIEEINGVKNSGGQYWTLYVNNLYSNVGAAAYNVAQGDIIEWKYEK